MRDRHHEVGGRERGLKIGRKQARVFDRRRDQIESRRRAPYLRTLASRCHGDSSNAAVLVPTFNDPNDPIALTTLTGVFPTRKVVGIHAVDLVWGLGTLHCLTQQQPVRGT